MDARELRARARHYRRTAALVSDEEAARALLELADEYDATADRLTTKEPTPRAAQC
jgi:hypothetical protein